MVTQSRKLHTVALVATGAMLILWVSVATATIVMWIPERSMAVEPGQQIVINMNEYVLLHKARNAVVPPYLQVGLDDSAH